MASGNSRSKMDYIKDHKIHVLFEQLAGSLLSDRPVDPIPFLIEQLQRLGNPAGSSTSVPVAPAVAPPNPPKPGSEPFKITLAVFGLEAAGKSTLISAVAGSPDPDVPPTVGFSPSHFASENWDLMLFDLGGGAKFRSIWKEYYSELHGVIFVVDSADSSRFEEAKDALWGILNDDRATGKPLAIFANKQDMGTAKTAVEVEKALQIQTVQRHHVFGCSAIADPSQPFDVDENIEKGMEWILQEVTASFDDLTGRVRRQLAEDKERRKQAMAEQAKRVEEYRKEWAAAEQGKAT